MRPTKVNLKLLQLFVLVAEHSSFRLAAERANRSQSVVSTQIKSLEAQLGTSLFERTTRRVRLTSAGEQLLACVQRGLKEVELGLAQIEDTVEFQQGRVSISCSPTIAFSRLPAILWSFRKQHPKVKVFVQELTSTELYESIRDHKVDFGIGPLTHATEFDFSPVLSEDLYALALPGLLDTDGLSIPLAVLTNAPLLLLHPATALRAQLEETVRLHGLSMNVECQFSQAQSLIGAAAAGLGAAILPRIALPSRLDCELEILRITDPIITRQIGIIALRGRVLPPSAQRLSRITKELLQADLGRSLGER